MTEKKTAREELFTNGIQLLHATTERGPSLYSILEGFWYIPVLLMGLRQKIWEHTDLDKVDPVAALWLHLKLMQPVFAAITKEELDAGKEPEVLGLELTEAGHSMLACHDLIEYEYGMAEQQLSGQFDTDPEKYKQLRGGLAGYSKFCLPELFDWITGICPEDARVLDMAGGCGQYISHILEQRPRSSGVLLDKAPGITNADLPKGAKNRCAVIQGDILDHPLYDASAGSFDVVIMSEILHCMDEEKRLQLIKNAHEILKMGGVLVVLEQFPSMRLDLRLFQLTEGGHCIDMERVAYEVQAMPFKPMQTVSAISHYGVMFAKVETEKEKS